MASYKLLAFMLVCAPSAFAYLGARDHSPTRIATGEEIQAAVEQADRDLAEVGSKRSLQPGNQSVLASALPY